MKVGTLVGLVWGRGNHPIPRGGAPGGRGGYGGGGGGLGGGWAGGPSCEGWGWRPSMPCHVVS